MTAFETLVRTPLAGALGWTLLHSLWEGTIAAAGLAFVLSVARSSRVRYAASCLALIGILLSAVITLARVMPEAGRAFVATTVVPAPAPALSIKAAAAVKQQLRLGDIVPWLSPFWIAGVLLFNLRA